MLLEESRNPRKSLRKIDPLYMAHIEIHWARFLRDLAEALSSDRPRHHVARREFQHRMIALHKALTPVVAKICALTAQSLRQQEARHSRQAQRGGMKLVKLHVRDLGSRAIRHRDSVAGRDRRVRRVAIDLTRAAAGEQHGFGANLRSAHRRDPELLSPTTAPESSPSQQDQRR